jgi:flagellar hook-associated protein 2
VVYVAGYEHRSTTNTFADAIDGISLTLLDEGEEDKTYSLTVGADTASTTARIKKFVEAYNALEKQIAALRSYSPETKQAGPLLGDAMLRGIESDLRARVTGAVTGLTGTYQSLASIGITTQRDGTLGLDTEKLSKALEADFDGVAKLFGWESGVAARLASSLDTQLGATAQINTRTKALNARSVELQKQQAALETRMVEVQKRYNAQFNALDSLLSSLGSQSAFLSQQLTAISKIGDK